MTKNCCRERRLAKETADDCDRLLLLSVCTVAKKLRLVQMRDDDCDDNGDVKVMGDDDV